jgi:hypothetical protein
VHSATAKPEPLDGEEWDAKSGVSEAAGCTGTGRIGPSTAERSGGAKEEVGRVQLQQSRAKQKTETEMGQESVETWGRGRRGAGVVARMRLCAVGDVLLPEGLQPQGGGGGWRRRGCRSRPCKSTKALARRTHGEDETIAGTVSPRCCWIQDGRRVQMCARARGRPGQHCACVLTDGVLSNSSSSSSSSSSSVGGGARFQGPHVARGYRGVGEAVQRTGRGRVRKRVDGGVGTETEAETETETERPRQTGGPSARSTDANPWTRRESERERERASPPQA